MIADYSAGCNTCAGRCSEIYNPLAGSWGYNWDIDNDGILDSIVPNIFFGCGSYNGFNPLHNKTGNALFSDGAVLRIHRAKWAQNDGGLWGDGKGTGKPNPYR